MLEVVMLREHKVAIATEDGKRISAHFRSAPFFLVYTIKRGRLTAAESRENARAAAPLSGKGSAECWKVIDETLDDVRVVICSGMGENAYVGLLRRDILPLLTDEEYADRALDLYLRGCLKERAELVHEHACVSGRDRRSRPAGREGKGAPGGDSQ